MTAHVDTFARDHLPPADQWPKFLNIPGVTYPERVNASVALLDETVRTHGPERTAFIAAEGTWSYGELADKVGRIANVLVNNGLVPGGRVVLRGPNNAWLAACWLAVLRAGGVVVTTIPMVRAMELEPILQISQPTLAIVDHRFTEEWVATSFSGTTLVYGGDGPDRLELLAEAASPAHSAVDTQADDISMLAFTSGTTGRPKATMHNHRDILAIADSFSAQIVKPTSEDVFAGSPPLGFTFGLGGLVIFPMRVGASSVLLEAGAPPLLIKAIQDHRVTCLFTAPTAYRAMLGLLPEHDVSSLRRCVSAGETLPLATWQAWFDATGIRLIDGIGATEMLHIFISAADDEIVPGSTGKPVPGYEACILDEDGNEVAPGTPGRLAVRGPTGCRYLADDRQQTYVQGGWNITGDVYIQDDQGYFTYQARADDMIVTSGYNVGAPEVENALLMHPAVAETAVVGVPDAERGSIIKAFVVLRDGFTADDDMVVVLQDHVKGTIAPYKYPRVVEFVDALPKTTTGKLQRFRLKGP
jgi:2-aminobenzoate-CoA ligase